VYDYSTQGGNWATGVCATGQGQSPIDINGSATTVTTKYDQFELTNWENPHKWTVKNTGHGVKLVPAVEDMTFTGGDFSEEYTLAQFHFHWGSTMTGGAMTGGSEHTFDGTQFFSEVHFVHYKSIHADLDAAVASGQQDDLAVLGFWLEIDDTADEGPFDYLITDIIDDKVKTYNSVTETKETVFWSPNHLIDVEAIKTAPFYRYDGTLEFLE
jgi:carbonic anhydrase